jgi:hypothetical protein
LLWRVDEAVSERANEQVVGRRFLACFLARSLFI